MITAFIMRKNCGRKGVMADPNPANVFFLIVIDFDMGLFCVEGPMTDDAPWNLAAGRAREKHRNVQCGPASPDRGALVSEFQRTHKMGGVPPGSIVRPRG
jgi:hypothetical protein